MQAKREWSEYQKAIFNEISKGSGNVMIEALAGCAKTSSLIESLKYLQKGKSSLLVAFAKKNAEDLKDKAPSYSNLHISTLHSLGYAVVWKKFSNIKLDPTQTFTIITHILDK